MLEVMGTLPSVWLLAGLFMFKFVLWLWVLARTELSFAQPVTSLSYVGVALISAFVLKESWHWQNFASVILILVGVKLVSDSQGDEAT
jgi:drug/metabolite transporter (DMT)-like permease